MKIFIFCHGLSTARLAKTTAHRVLVLVSMDSQRSKIPEPVQNRVKWSQGKAADFFLRPPILTAGNFEALQSTDPILTALKYLNHLKKCVKYEEASYNFRLGFACSKNPHFNSTY